MNPKRWRIQPVRKHSLAFTEEVDTNIERDVGRRYIGLMKLFVAKVCLENLHPSLHRISSGIMRRSRALQAVLINYLPVAANTAPVTLHHCPRTLIQKIHADTPFKAVLFP